MRILITIINLARIFCLVLCDEYSEHFSYADIKKIVPTAH